MRAPSYLLYGTSLLYLFVVSVSVLIAASPAAGLANPPSQMDPAVGMLVGQIGFILLPSLLFAWLTRQSFATVFKLRRLDLWGGLQCFLLGLIGWAVFIFLSNLTQLLLSRLGPQPRASTDIASAGGSLWLVFLGTVLVAPLCEEAFCRGLLLSVYEQRLGSHAVWLVGLLFACLHLSPDQLLGALFVGSVAGWVVYRTRSLWAGVLVHIGTNLLNGLLILVITLAAPAGMEAAATGTAQAGDASVMLWMGAMVWGTVSLVMLVPGYFLIRSLNKRHLSPGLAEAKPGLNAMA
jgi:membrane protease YdiL (CAAX protease family)